MKRLWQTLKPRPHPVTELGETMRRVEEFLGDRPRIEGSRRRGEVDLDDPDAA